jgi:hypothetical protein
MSEELVTIVILVTFGLLLVLFPGPIAALYCRFMKEVWRLHRNDLLARALEGAVWVVERVSLGRVHDEATAPKAFRFMGFASLWTALFHAFLLR